MKRKAFTPYQIYSRLCPTNQKFIWHYKLCRKNKLYCKFGSGFTFIELLVAISIFSAVAVSIYSAFNTGIIAWRRLTSTGDVYQQATSGLGLMANEIANFIPSQKIRLQGDKARISFLSRLENEGICQMAEVGFYLDPLKKTVIIRSQEDLRSVLNRILSKTEETEASISTEAIIEEFLPDIDLLEFKYFCKKTDKEGEYEWLDSLDPEGKSVCIAVSITIAKASMSFTKITPLYVGEGKDGGNPQ